MVANVITQRLELAGLDSKTIDVEALARFIKLMAKWNRHINLTALPIDPPAADAIDRLIVEPVAAAKLLDRPPDVIADIGSGGGSPAIPFRLQFPSARLTMVESRSKKCAFLREAARSLEITGTTVLESRFEEVSPAGVERADLVTMRAVRLDAVTVRLIRVLSRPGATLVRFTSETSGEAGESDQASNGLRLISELPLVAATKSSIQLFHVEH